MDFTARASRLAERLERALARASRSRASVLLVAVSKGFPAEIVEEAARGGFRVFGENRVQEAARKIPRVAQLLGHDDLSWHLVGHLQSNKARAAVSRFDLVHSVDDAELARRLDGAALAANEKQPVLVQVNLSGEETKSGVAAGSLRPLVETIAGLENLELRGLMIIPPYDPDPDQSRRHFAALRELGETVRLWLRPAPYAGELSMGMTEDLEVAVEEGATIVRVGRGLFGERTT